jgi:hypothetical protein
MDAGEADVDAAPTVSISKMASSLAKEQDPRLARIRAMQAEGRTEDARSALRALLAEQPHIALDPELRALLP